MKQYKQTQPPKWAMKALRFICHTDFREEIEGDFLEKYYADLQKYGLKTARKQCYIQLFSVIKPNLIFNFNQHKMRSVLNIKENPFALLLFTAIAALVAIVFTPVANVEFQDKTMFSIPLGTMVWIIPLLLIFFWLLYFLTKKFLYSKTITWIHVLITVITTLLIAAILYIGINPSPYTSNRHELIGNVIQLLSVIFVFGQLIYLTNFVLGFLGRHNGQ